MALGYVPTELSADGTELEVEINGEMWTDGGIRAVSPLSAAIDAGADAIDMLLLTPAEPHPRFDPKASAIEVGLRCLDIMLDEIVDNDAKMALLVSRELGERDRTDIGCI